MDLTLGALQPERLTELSCEFAGVVAGGRQTRTPLGAVSSEASDHGHTARRERPSGDGHIGRAIVRIDQEVEHGTVVPRIPLPVRHPGEQVRGDERHVIATFRQTFPNGHQRGLGDVEHGHVLDTGVEECIDEDGRPGTDIDHGSRRRNEVGQQSHGHRGISLEPAEILDVPSPIDALPVHGAGDVAATVCHTFSVGPPGGVGCNDGDSGATGVKEETMSADEVDEYLERLDEPRRSTLERLRRSILAVVPDAEQGMSYGAPAFRIDGKVIAGFSASAKHLSYLPHSGEVTAALDTDELGSFPATKGAVKMPIDTPLPDALVRRLIAIRRLEVGV